GHHDQGAPRLESEVRRRQGPAARTGARGATDGRGGAEPIQWEQRVNAMHSTSGRGLKNEPVFGVGIPENGGQRPGGGPAGARGGRPTILLHVSQFMAGRQLAEYAFHSGFLPSLLGTLPLGGLFGATPKIPPGIETGQHSVRLGSIRGTGRSSGRL